MGNNSLGEIKLVLVEGLAYSLLFLFVSKTQYN